MCTIAEQHVRRAKAAQVSQQDAQTTEETSQEVVTCLPEMLLRVQTSQREDDVIRHMEIDSSRLNPTVNALIQARTVDHMVVDTSVNLNNWYVCQ